RNHPHHDLRADKMVISTTVRKLDATAQGAIRTVTDMMLIQHLITADICSYHASPASCINRKAANHSAAAKTPRSSSTAATRGSSINNLPPLCWSDDFDLILSLWQLSLPPSANNRELLQSEEALQRPGSSNAQHYRSRNNKFHPYLRQSK